MTGLWFGTAFVAIGVVITTPTLIGFFFIGEAFPLWMAFVNGGGLILGGLDAADLMAELDDIIHQPLRLKIMAALNALPATAGLEFSRLTRLTGATDGNLGAQIETLAKAGYVSVEKAFVGKKPQTTVTATAAGRGAFARHVATLQEIIAGKQG